MGCACSRWPGPESRCRGQTGKGTVGLSRVKSSLCFSLLLLLPVIWHHSCPDPAGGGDCDLLTLAYFKGCQSFMADIIVTVDLLYIYICFSKSVFSSHANIAELIIAVIKTCNKKISTYFLLFQSFPCDTDICAMWTACASSCVLLRWYWGAECYGEQLWLHQGTRRLSLGSALAVQTGSGAVNVWEFRIKMCNKKQMRKLLLHEWVV